MEAESLGGLGDPAVAEAAAATEPTMTGLVGCGLAGNILGC